MLADAHAPCPCCGRAFVGPLEIGEIAVAARLTPQQTEILEILGARHGKWMKALQIADRLYQLRPDGGPDCGSTGVKVQIHHIRRLLAGTALHIETGGKCGRRLVANIESSGDGYRLAPHSLSPQTEQKTLDGMDL